MAGHGESWRGGRPIEAGDTCGNGRWPVGGAPGGEQRRKTLEVGGHSCGGEGSLGEGLSTWDAPQGPLSHLACTMAGSQTSRSRI
jgi:hypothetical protein